MGEEGYSLPGFECVCVYACVCVWGGEDTHLCSCATASSRGCLSFLQKAATGQMESDILAFSVWQEARTPALAGCHGRREDALKGRKQQGWSHHRSELEKSQSRLCHHDSIEKKRTEQRAAVVWQTWLMTALTSETISRVAENELLLTINLNLNTLKGCWLSH